MSVIHILENGCRLFGHEDGTLTGFFLTPMLCNGSKTKHCVKCHKHDAAVVAFAWIKLGIFASHSADGVVKIWDSMFGTYYGTLAETVWPPTEASVEKLCRIN